MANTSVFPQVTAGGLEVRDAQGDPAAPAGVEQAYSPAPAFVSTCPIMALPSDCTARIEPRQINAIVSELVSFAECLDPNGPWDCASLKNLCAAFATWVSTNLTDREVLVTAPELVGTGLVGAPITFTGITAEAPTFSGNGLSASPLMLDVIDGGVY